MPRFPQYPWTRPLRQNCVLAFSLSLFVKGISTWPSPLKEVESYSKRETLSRSCSCTCWTTGSPPARKDRPILSYKWLVGGEVARGIPVLLDSVSPPCSHLGQGLATGTRKQV
jgi:hypothetical protein